MIFRFSLLLLSCSLLAGPIGVQSFAPPVPRLSRQNSDVVVFVSLTPDDNEGNEVVPTPSMETEEAKEDPNKDLITAGLLALCAVVAYNVVAFVLGGVHDIAVDALSAVGSGVSEAAGSAAGAVGSAALQGAGAVVGAVGSAAVDGVKVAAPVVGKAVVGASQAVSEAATPLVQEASKQLGEAAAPYVQEASSKVDATIVAPIKDAVDASLVAPLQDVASDIGNAVDIGNPFEGAADSVSNALDGVKGALPFDAF